MLLWWLAGEPALGPSTRSLIGDGGNEVYVSAATAWEIAIKKAQGKLRPPRETLGEVHAEEGFAPLSVTVLHAERVGDLPPIHRDPFDRMLVAQALAEGLQLVTGDRTIQTYPVPTVDARA